MIVYSLVALLICELFLEGFIYFYGRKRDDVACDVMIVLGAGLYGDQISSALKRRLKQALYYAQRYPEVQIVVSGGQGANETMSEAMAMKMYLIKQGIASTRIIMEDRSTSTYTNFLY
ncbi:MAG: YdcF family protein, partial [Erysipelotrichia bacterium]|nr:YdcF family protein [Erysipelotrichia bacterium]